tara:strand:- start:1811 stop:2059 length:249 start_codon:yes stop_codon:yes gene_type:complete
MKCNHCKSNQDKYVMLYEKDADQPAKIDLWAIHNGEHICVGSITNVEVLKGVQLKPVMFCANCHSLLPFQQQKESNSTSVEL